MTVGVASSHFANPLAEPLAETCGVCSGVKVWVGEGVEFACLFLLVGVDEHEAGVGEVLLQLV